MRYLMLLLALAAGSASAQIAVDTAWARATPPNSKIGAGYLTIRNAGAAPDRLIGVSTPAADRVEMHVTAKNGDMLQMREVKAYTIPAKGAFVLAPNGPHLMLQNLKAPLKEGASVPMTLKFEKAGEVKTQLQVRSLTASPPSHH
jgi:periplasmic copper chaperone A